MDICWQCGQVVIGGNVILDTMNENKFCSTHCLEQWTENTFPEDVFPTPQMTKEN